MIRHPPLTSRRNPDDSLLYFAFTQIEDGELVDESGNGRNATLGGDNTAEIVPDVGLGRAPKVAGAAWAALPPDSRRS